MARRKPYPVEAARTLRLADVVTAQDRLREAVATHRASVERLAHAERRLAVDRGAARPMPSSGAQAASASMLQRHAAYRARQQQREARLADAAANARCVCERTYAALERARRELSAARASQEQVERHRRGFLGEQKRLSAELEERELESQWAARHAPFKPKGRNLA